MAADRYDPLPGLPGPLADSERERLARQRRMLHQDRVECLMLLGRYPQALDELMAAPLVQPHDEPLAALDEPVTSVRDFYVRTNLGVPPVDRDGWTLAVDGLVANPLSLSLADLVARAKRAK